MKNKTDKNVGSCNISGLETLCINSFNSVKVSENYIVSLKKIGENIIYVKASGSLRSYNSEQDHNIKSKFIKAADVSIPYIKIIDFQDLKDNPHFIEIKKKMEYYYSNQDKILAVIYINSPEWIKPFIDQGLKILDNKLNILRCENYSEAIKVAQKIKMSNKEYATTNTEKSHFKFEDLIFKKDWIYENTDTEFKYKVGLIPGKMFYLSFYGKFNSKKDLDTAKGYLLKIMRDNKLIGIPYIITDLSNFNYLKSLKLRFYFTKLLENGVRETNNNKAVRFVVNPDDYSKMLIAASKKVFNTKHIIVNSVQEAFDKINNIEKPLANLRSNKSPENKDIKISNSDIEELSKALGELIWLQTDDSSKVKVSEDNPLSYIYDSIEIIKGDIRDMRQRELMAKEMQLKDARKSKQQLVSMMEDAEKAKLNLQKEKDAKKILLDNIPTQIWFLSDPATYGEVNKAHAKFKGYKISEIAYKSFYDIYPNDIAKQWEEINKKVFKNKKIVKTEELVADASGQERFLIITKTPKIGRKGKVEYVVCAAEDITDTKINEKKLKLERERLDKMLSITGTRINILDKNYNLHFVDKAWQNIYGNPDGKKCYEYFNNRKSFCPNCNVHEAFKNKKVIVQERLLAKENRIYEIHTIPFKAETGEWLFAEFNVDITERKQSEETLKKANKHLEELKNEATEMANKAKIAHNTKSEFLSNMSHEIRTPLNAIIGFSELLSDTKIDDTQTKYVNNITNSAASLLSIVNDILDLSKIEAGKLNLEIIKTDIVKLLEETTDIAKYAAAKKNLDFLLNVDSEVPRFVYLDPLRIRQVLSNLISNAVKFTKHGEVELKLELVSKNKSDANIKFSIRDTGIGIKNDHKNRLFKAFSQADSSTTRKYGGTGLGLIISNSLVKKMGGEINFKSKYNVGSEFYFNINAKVEEADNFINVGINKVKRVLIVDDNDNSRKLLKNTLEDWKIEVTSADNGLSAFKILEANSEFDAVIIDYSMPFIDGIETIKFIFEKLKLNKLSKSIILMHNATETNELEKACNSLGIKYRIDKPIKKQELFDSLINIKSNKAKKSKLITSADNSKQNIDSITSDNKAFTVLVTEDNLTNRFVLNSILRKNYPTVKIIEAENGVEAIEQYKKNTPDIIFMDVQMPIMNGLEATIKIREIEKKSKKHIPIIAITAGVFEEDKQKCFSAGMDYFLTKPIDTKQLTEHINRCVVSGVDNSIEDTLVDSPKADSLTSFNQDKLIEKYDSKEFCKELLKISKEQMDEKIPLLNSSIEKNDFENIRFHSHAIKGIASEVYYEKLKELASEIQKMAIEKSLKEIRQTFDNLKLEWNNILSILDANTNMK